MKLVCQFLAIFFIFLNHTFYIVAVTVSPLFEIIVLTGLETACSIHVETVMHLYI